MLARASPAPSCSVRFPSSSLFLFVPDLLSLGSSSSSSSFSFSCCYIPRRPRIPTVSGQRAYKYNNNKQQQQQQQQPSRTNAAGADQLNHTEEVEDEDDLNVCGPPNKPWTAQGVDLALHNTSKPVPRRIASFARLKSQKMTALINRYSSPITKQAEDDEEHIDIDGGHPQLSTTTSGGGDHDDTYPVLLESQSQLTRPTTTPLGFPTTPKTQHHHHHHPSHNPRSWSDARSRSNHKNQNHIKLPTDSGFFSRKSFKDLGCTEDVIQSLTSQSFFRPSHIQAMAYRPVLQGKTCIIADQSGSGKTLAYLAPIAHRLRQEELLGLGKSSPKCPRAVILVPTAELASQVLNNCRSMAKFGVPFRSMVATGGFRQKTQLDNLQQEMDVLVATPGRFMFLLEEGSVQLTNLKCVVLDEVDILFGDEGFEQVLQRLIGIAPMATQYLFVTATLPVDVYNKLVEHFPDCEVCMGPGVHRTSSRLEEILVDCSGDDGEGKNPDTAFQNKKSALLQLVKESPVPKTIIFCNKIETCRKVENVMQRIDRKGVRIKVLPFHAALAQEVRVSNMREFLTTYRREPLFLVCTDRASRGIDFASVDHVVLFDFPRDPSEYVRRVGRTARGAGGKGKAFILVVGKQLSLARRIIERNKKGNPLHDIPLAYELES